MHYTYVIKNMCTGLLYIGVHTGTNEYWGSSYYLTEDIKLLGKEHFKKRILKVWPTRTDAVAHEIELHDKYDVASSERFYNKVKQTSIGFDSTGFKWSEQAIKKRSKALKQTINDPQWKATTGKEKNKTVSETRQNWSQERKDAFSSKISETRKKLGLAKGANNPFYGTKMALGKKWYSNDVESKLCIPGTEPKGYVLGRITVKGSNNPRYKHG